MKWIIRIIGFLIGVALLGFFLWLGVSIGEWAGLIK